MFDRPIDVPMRNYCEIDVFLWWVWNLEIKFFFLLFSVNWWNWMISMMSLSELENIENRENKRKKLRTREGKTYIIDSKKLIWVSYNWGI